MIEILTAGNDGIRDVVAEGAPDIARHGRTGDGGAVTVWGEVGGHGEQAVLAMSKTCSVALNASLLGRQPRGNRTVEMEA